MTVKVEIIEGGVPHQKVMIVGLIFAIVCIYLTYLNVLTKTEMFSFFGGLAAVAALVWGSSTIKVLCSYGIGTGVPSAGMVSFGSGVIAMLFATKFGIMSPIVAVILAAVIGAILGFIANSVLAMKIPVMVKSLIELAMVGSLTLMGFTALITGSFNFSVLSAPGMVLTIGAAGLTATTSYLTSYIGGALIATIFLLGAIAVQHPFNACLGPNWTQDRMLMLACECGFISMIVASLMALPFMRIDAVLISIIVSVIGWYYTYAKYFELSRRDAAAWLDLSPIPEQEGH